MSGRIGFLIGCAIVLLTAGFARAQSAPTCTFDPAAAAVTVSVNGGETRLRAMPTTGEIRLNGGPCAGATVFNTDTIEVSGGSLIDDEVSLSGTFARGLTPEATGGSEIEISISIGQRNDFVVVNLGGGSDRLVFTSDGIDVGNDGDRDILTAGTARTTVNANGGNDRIDASAYSGSRYGPGIIIHGGPGRDVLTGAISEGNWLYGEEGDDVLYGGDFQDNLYGGLGDDRMVGNGGSDYFIAEATADGADDMRGGDGNDTVRYIDRTNGVTVTIGDTEPDGEPGEGDRVRADVENVWGGEGPDVLVGNGLPNGLEGWRGDDELYGGGGDDDLSGTFDNDILVGDGGDDTLHGGGGDDFLEGGLGNDVLHGATGKDILRGGPGPDTLDGGNGLDEFFGDEGNDTFVNADDRAETIDCGAGLADDPQPSALDTFIACEEI